VAPLSEKNRALAPWFVDYVNRLRDSANTREAEENETKGRTYTTIDLELQQLAENALEHQLSRLDETYKERGARPQAALVALDPHSGNVLAMVGA
jgi:penicillin-binding protein 1B